MWVNGDDLAQPKRTSVDLGHPTPENNIHCIPWSKDLQASDKKINGWLSARVVVKATFLGLYGRAQPEVISGDLGLTDFGK